MLAASAAFAATVDGVDVTVDARVSISLPGGIYPDLTLAVESLKIDASATSSQPGQSRVAGGTPSTTAEFTVSGLVDPTDETKTAAWLFGSWQSTSPLYRQTVLQRPVTIDLGVVPDGGAPELLRKFTGFIDSKTVNSDGSVTFSCYDKRNLLRGQVNLPAVVTAPPYNAGLTSEFAVDWLVRAATSGAVGSWPAQRPSCVFAASMRGSLWPEVGSLNGANSSFFPTFQPGAFGTALANFADANGVPLVAGSTINYTTSAEAGATFYAECFTSGTAAFNKPWTLSVNDGGTSNVAGMAFTWDGYGSMTVQVYNNANVSSAQSAAGQTVLPDGVYYRAVKFTMSKGSGSWSATCYVNNNAPVTLSGKLPNSAVRPTTAWNTVSLTDSSGNGGAFVGIEAVQVSNETAPATNYGFVPTLKLDPSLNSLSYVPQVQGDPWSTLQSLAEAELAVVGFDESGTMMFRNRNTIRTSPLVRTLRLVKSLDEDENLASLINHARVEYVGATYGKPGVVWSLSDVVQVPKGGGTATIVASTESAVGAISQTPVGLLNNASPGAVSRYRASTTRAGVDEFPNYAALRWTVAQTASDEVTIRVTNPTGTDCWLVSPSNYTDTTAGAPFLQLVGTAMTANDSSVVDAQYPPLAANGTGGAAASRWGDLLSTISGNAWLQTYKSAATLAGFIVEDQPVPRPDLSNVSIVPDVRLQLLDRVAVVEPDRHGISGEHAVIFGWTIELSRSDFSMTVDARTVTSPGGWLLGVSGRSELGATTYT